MAHPKNRKSHSKTRMGRSHHHLKVPTLVNCSNCGHKVPPHRACPECGQYKGREVIEVA